MNWYAEPLILWMIIIALFIIVFKLFFKKPDERQMSHSESVRWGFAFEKFVPFMKNFPYEAKNSIPVMGGNPIDYINIDYDKGYVRFIEVKTGKAQLNQREKELKRMIDRGRVTYEVIRDN